MKRAAYHCACIVPARNVVPLSCRYSANGLPVVAAEPGAAAAGLSGGGYHLAHAAGVASMMGDHRTGSAHVVGLGFGLGLGLGRGFGLGLEAPGRTGYKRESEQQRLKDEDKRCSDKTVDGDLH